MLTPGGMSAPVRQQPMAAARTNAQRVRQVRDFGGGLLGRAMGSDEARPVVFAKRPKELEIIFY